MADEDEDKSQKTEQPTERRLEDALKKGNVVYSRELTTFLMMLAFTASVIMLSPSITSYGVNELSYYIENAGQMDVASSSLRGFFLEIFILSIKMLALPMLLAMVAAITSSLIQNGGFIFSFEPITPKLEKISIIKGFERLFSSKSLVEFLKGIFKIITIAVVAYLSVAAELPAIKNLYDKNFNSFLENLYDLASFMLVSVTIAIGIIAAFDFFYQKYKYIENLKMSKSDIKKEYKESEGSPEIKSKLKQIRASRAKSRMMANVPKADVIITNPTHFSIALQYDQLTMTAPIVVAKGQDQIALKIREIAKEHDIPLYENKELARALFASAEIDQEIPLEHYKAVAEVISYVYKLKGRVH